ncbi:MAG TPA: hypothetical protein VGF94_27120 [Kofleriaceae bacterium]
MRGVVVAIVVLAASRVAAQPAREVVLVAADDPAFQDALDEVLAPAGLATRAIEAAPPSLTDITRVSRELADREHATATIWLVTGPTTTTLVTYDRDVDRVLVRAIKAAPPLDAAQRAQAARMARTMLRALRVTPDTNLPPPRAEQAPAVRAAAAAAVEPVARRTLALGVGAGTRAGEPAATLAFDGNATLVWRPDALGIALAGQYSPANERTTPAFAGNASDDAIALCARLPLELAGRELRIVVLAGGALHVETLRGTTTAGMTVSETRFDPALRAGAVLEHALDPSVDVGLAVTGDYLLERQRYALDNAEILLIPRAQLTAAFVLTLRLL